VEANPVIQLFLSLGLIIAAAQIAGTVARSFHQPRVFGELLAGVILGPTVLNILHWSVFDDPAHLEDSIHEFAELGVLFLMFTVGLEVHLKELLNVGKVAVWGGTIGAIFPVLLATPLVLAFDHPFEEGVFVGVVMAATSVSISAQTLLELGVLRTKEGFGLLATAVVDDVIAILLLSVVIATMAPGTETASIGALAWIFVKMALYIGGALSFAWFILPRLFNRLYANPRYSSGIAAFALIAALIFGWSAEALGGVAAITGAFIAGIGIAQSGDRVKHDIEVAVRAISYSLLVPIFFVNVGLHTNLREIGFHLLPLAALLLLAAVISKVVGSGLGAKLGGFTTAESMRLGVCMISRGEVGLIIASVGLANGLLEGELFQPIFLVILLTTVITPPLVRIVFRGRAEAEQKAYSRKRGARKA
jgi:Kef-type K+ transport system membrane component KefB